MALLLVAGLVIASPAAAGSRCYACSHRSAEAKAEFKRQHPCPATGRTRGPCRGFIVDHVQPLCAGGLDAPGNMAWQSTAEAKAKDKIERRMCR